MQRWIVAIAIGLITWLGWGGMAPTLAETYQSPAPDSAEVYFITPSDGETVTSPVTVKFGLRGMGVAPAGVDKPDTGHHHLLVDLATLPNLDESLPATDHIKHFGGGQTETTLNLPPGEHTLQLLLANYVHVPYAPPVVSDKITVTVN
ncbi:MAG: DUF4399 domain-containing protein [Leptolyngbyaceae cyanobacterium T60_A2020_046]|nr:DUF4399 domain-containing protein [Leptolyngbyaceae cyanobacterium T60_A2020_046]